MIVPGSMWRMDSSTIIFDNVDLVRSPFRMVPEGSIVLVLAGPFKFERLSARNPHQSRFWFWFWSTAGCAMTGCFLT